MKCSREFAKNVIIIDLLHIQIRFIIQYFSSEDFLNLFEKDHCSKIIGLLSKENCSPFSTYL